MYYAPHSIFWIVIRSFRSRETERFFKYGAAGPFGAVSKVAMRKLQAIHAAPTLAVLAAVPGNRMEKLRGGRAGQWSIRINEQWRICFRWTDGAEDVEIVDYH